MRQLFSALLCASIFFSCTVSISQQPRAANVIASAQDGTLYCVRSDNNIIFLEHCAADGSLLKMISNSFGGVVCPSVAVTIQPNGKIVVAALLQKKSERSVALIRYLPDTMLVDNSFGYRGIVLLEGPSVANYQEPVVAYDEGLLLLADDQQLRGASTVDVLRITEKGLICMPDGSLRPDLSGRVVTRACPPTGPLTVDKIFCYPGCETVMFGHRDGVRVMITKDGDDVIEELFCTQKRTDVFPSDLTCPQYDALVADCAVCCGTDIEPNPFQGTWTALEAFDQLMDEKFQQTWTIIEALQPIDVYLSVTVSTDFSTLYTAIAGSTSELCKKFQETWTLIEGLNLTVDLSSVYTVIAASADLACEEFQQTWTIIEGISALVQEDFQGTWTLIEGIETTICNQFDQVFTDLNIIEGLVQQITTSQAQELVLTLSVLNKLCHEVIDTVTEVQQLVLEMQEIFTGIDEFFTDLFAQTWTIIAAVDQFAEIWTALQGCCDLLQENQMIFFCQELSMFEQTYTALAALFDCMPTPITAPITIVTPGIYCLANDISDTTMATPIIIQASNVTLDLNGHQVSKTSGTGDIISLAAGLSNITIKNGYISAVTGTNGIHIVNDTNVTVDNIAFTGAGTAVGVLVNNTPQGGSATDGLSRFITISNSTFVASGGGVGTIGINIAPATAVAARLVSEVVIQDCFIRGFFTAGISLLNTTVCSISRCFMQGCGQGIRFIGSCTNCVLQGCNASSNTGNGVQFSANTTDTIIKDNIVRANTTTGISTGAVVNSGISIEGNVVTANGALGVGASASNMSDTVITQNNIARNGTGGILIGNSQRSAINNNFISANTGIGIQTTALLSSMVRDNKILGSGTGSPTQTVGIQLAIGSGATTVNDNCIFRNSTQGILLAGITGSSIKNNGIITNGGIGISITGASRDLSVVNNNISRNGATAGISIAVASRDFMIADNTITSNTGLGITTGVVSLSFSTIKNNLMASNTTTADLSIVGGGVCVQENAFVNNGNASGVVSSATESVFDGNIVLGNPTIGMSFLAASDNCTVSNNIVANNGTTGMTVAMGSSNHNFYKNIVNKNTGVGITVGGNTGDNNSFVGNIAHRNSTGASGADNYTQTAVAPSVIPFQYNYAIGAATYTLLAPSTAGDAATNNITIIT